MGWMQRREGQSVAPSLPPSSPALPPLKWGFEDIESPSPPNPLCRHKNGRHFSGDLKTLINPNPHHHRQRSLHYLGHPQPSIHCRHSNGGLRTCPHLRCKMPCRRSPGGLNRLMSRPCRHSTWDRKTPLQQIQHRRSLHWFGDLKAWLTNPPCRLTPLQQILRHHSLHWFGDLKV